MCAAMVTSLFAGCGSSDASTTASNSGSTTGDGTEAAAEDAVEDATESAESEVVTNTFGDPNGTHLEMWTFVELHGQHYGKMAEVWNEEHPDQTIEITCTTYPYSDMHTKLLTALQAGTGAPDICDVEVGQFPNAMSLS